MKMQKKYKFGSNLLAIGMAFSSLAFMNSAKAAIVSNVIPSEILANQSNTITITGDGFTDAPDVEVFRQTDYIPADEIRFTDLSFTIINDNEIRAVVPAGLRAGDYEVWVGSDVMENALRIGSVVTPDISQLDYSLSKKARKTIILDFSGVVLGKKAWTTIKFNGKKSKVKRVSVNGNNTRVLVEIRYRKWARGFYDINLKYKNKIREEIDNNGYTAYRNRWEKDNITYSEVLEII